jgi:hypothetical protein
MITKYFCARYFSSTTITREDFEKVTAHGFGVRAGGSKRALETQDWESFNTWELARDHLLATSKRELRNAKVRIQDLEKMRNPYSLLGKKP